MRLFWAIILGTTAAGQGSLFSRMTLIPFDRATPA
jgi:hypothetical protein